MIKYYDISAWARLEWVNTGGTRSKRLLYNPTDNKNYFFKKSDKNYPFEFWSEVIASYLGKMLGFEMLLYEVGYTENEIGCISVSMHDPDKEELIEVGRLLQAHDNTFSPEDKKLRYQYTFQLIEDAFRELGMEDYMKYIFEVIVFDSVIGNGDRHQENWAFIGEYSFLSKSIKEIEYNIKSKRDLEGIPKALKKIVRRVFIQNKGNNSEIKPAVTIGKLKMHKNLKFAPIYDSGSSLMRECTEDKIKNMLTDTIQYEAYINRGVSEVHWEGKKISHFALINNLKTTKHWSIIGETIEKALKKYKSSDFEDFLNRIDAELPVHFSNFRLSKERKQLILKSVSLRAQKLDELL